MAMTKRFLSKKLVAALVMSGVFSVSGVYAATSSKTAASDTKQNSKSKTVAAKSKKTEKPVKSQAMKSTPKTVAAQSAARDKVVSATSKKPSRLLASKKPRDNPPSHWGEWNGPVGASPGLHSHAALLLDMQNGEALYQKNASQIVPIASITKIGRAHV